MIEDQIEGAVLGAAIGDAMGHPLEFIGSFRELRARHPAGITSYTLYHQAHGVSFAPFTDDTQMAEQVILGITESMSAGDDGMMEAIGRRFVEWKNDPIGGHRAPGRACLAGCAALERGVPWHVAGGEDAGGCGSVMRCYPFGLVFDEAKAEALSVSSSRLTHRHPIALAASAAMAVGIARASENDSPAAIMTAMIDAAGRYSPETREMMIRAREEAESGVAPEVTLDRLRGWAAHEAIAAAIYVFARHANDPRRAILEAAYTPGDSDSIATLAGALTGTLNGAASLPRSWIDEIERREDLLAHAARLVASRRIRGSERGAGR